MRKRLLALCAALLLLPTSAGAVLSVEDARELVERLYIDQVPQQVLERDTVEGIFAGLDQYSSYFTPEEYQSFLRGMNDVSTVGLGVVSTLSGDGSCLEILTVYEDGAAYAAGLRPGDAIQAIDGHLVSEAADLEEAGGWMRGEEGTTVTLTLTDGRVMTLTRAAFTIAYTTYQLLDGHIGYLDCDSFGGETYGHFAQAMQTLEGEADHWIVDLRDNSGGLTQAAADVAGLFSGSGVKALLRDRAGSYYGYATDKEKATLCPVILLVNGASASASELLAAAIRDGGAGLIIGSQTYGKGVAQTVLDQTVAPELFADGDAVRVTSYRFYSPSGVNNDRMGLLPHLVIEEPYVQAVARLLSGGTGQKGDRLELTLGSWRWNLCLEQALTEEFRPAFTALLEALWPDTRLILTTGEGDVRQVDAAEIAQRYGLTAYTPRVFDDAEESEYAYALNVLGLYGILQGDGSGSCDPGGALTRAQLCALLAQVLGTDGGGSAPFRDVPESAWYADAVAAMAELGLVEGDGTGAFHPEETLTNEQMIAVLARLADWLSATFHESGRTGAEEGALEEEVLAAYSDWAREGAWLLGRSQVNLFGRPISYLWTELDSIQPGEAALRENAAQSLFRLLTLVGALRQ